MYLLRFDLRTHLYVSFIVCAPFSYTKAFGEGPRHFERSDEDGTLSGTLLLTTTPTEGRVRALDRFHSPTRQVSSGTGLELKTRQPRVHYLDHQATVAIMYSVSSEIK
ncbi:hypothetical protein TNCV_3439491 [Trichonephila clavipes]|nr:hypothetical protein TNCV_3439491 [Trichonephila clavipes]